MDEVELFRCLMKTSFGLYARRAIAELSPALDLLWNWHLDLIADRLEQLASGKIKRLIINVPPRSLKSQLCTVIFPTWLLGLKPHLEVLCISYSQSLGEDFSRQSRRLMESPLYRRVFLTRLARDKRAVDQFETSAGGRRVTSSVGGTVTGRGGDFIIVDDPMKPEEALSDAGRRSTSAWLKDTLASRPNSKSDSPMLVIMQRLHEDDVTAELLRQGGWELLCLPAIADEREEYRYRTAMGRQVHVREAGKALHAERESLADLKRVELGMGAFTFAAQYRQQPMPAEGNLLKRSSIKRYSLGDIFAPEIVMQSWDTAHKLGELNDFSVCTTWAIKNGRACLLDVHRERLEQPALLERVKELAARFGAQFVLIEDKGSGTGLLQSLKADYFYKGVAILPKGDKQVRFNNVTPMFEAGQALLPENAPWAEGYIDELCGFPATKHDDQVDSTSQALSWIQERITMPAIIEYYRQENERARALEEDRTIHMAAPTGISHVGLFDGRQVSVGPDRTVWVDELTARTLSKEGRWRRVGN